MLSREFRFLDSGLGSIYTVDTVALDLVFELSKEDYSLALSKVISCKLWSSDLLLFECVILAVLFFLITCEGLKLLDLLVFILPLSKYSLLKF